MEAGFTTCPHCGRDVPREPYCVSCGEPLAAKGARRGYAAAPHEHWAVPRIVTSIFPQLPRADLRSFRLSLAGGVAIVVGLSLLHLYPLALVAAAVAVPLLFVLYLWDVDVYEDAPVVVLGFTVALAALLGAGLGWAAQRLPSEVALLRGHPDSHNLVWLGLILPAAAYVLSLAGPLALLPYRKFNDILDGVTFGACSAATLLAAEAIVNSADFLHLGFRAVGDRWLWVARLLTLGVTMPVLAAGAGGAACAALWLRYRATGRDRLELGPLGSPLVAVPLGGAALVGAAVSELYLKQWLALLLTAILALTALLWLRRLIEVGLRQEAGERPVGPPVECPNCHMTTPTHTFCGNCGAALHALPKAGAAHGTAPPRPARLGAVLRMSVFGALTGGALGLTSLAIALARPPAAEPPCRPGVPCAAPPASIPVAAPRLVAGAFLSGTTWHGTHGVSLRYGKPWSVLKSGPNGLVLQVAGGSGLFLVVAVNVAPSSISATDALAAQVSSQPDGFLGVQRDGSPSHAVLSPKLGFVHSLVSLYSATVDQPPSPAAKVELVFEAASHGDATVVLEAITNETAQGTSASAPFPVLQLADHLLTTFAWSGS